MNIDRVVFAFAGTVVVASLVLARTLSPYWLLLAGFVGLNMLQAAFTGFCPLAIVLRLAGVPAGCAFAGKPRKGSEHQGRRVMSDNIHMADPATVLEWYKSGAATIVDVRERREHEAGHIPGSVLVPLSSFDPRKVPVDPQKKLVFHCQGGMRCGPAAAKMLESGFSGEIHRLRGGFNAWLQAGGAVVRGA